MVITNVSVIVSGGDALADLIFQNLEEECGSDFKYFLERLRSMGSDQSRTQQRCNKTLKQKIKQVSSNINYAFV